MGERRAELKARAKSVVQRDAPFIMLTISVFVITFLCACTFSMDSCPDEYMRFPLARFIFEHGYLPNGDEEEIRATLFGFSYGYTPYLPTLLSAGLMRIVGLFTQGEWKLLVAARMVSCLSVTALAYVSCRIGHAAFGSRRSGFLCGVIVALTPQVLFLGSYVNNDAMALLSVALMVYAWVLGCGREGWTRRTEMLLAVGVAICSLSYYNDYGFILGSIIVYFVSSLVSGRGLARTFRGAAFISVIVLALAGWFFVRNAAIHNGDFLGTRTMYASGEVYGATEWKMSNRVTMAARGYDFYQAFLNPQTSLNDTPWFIMTLKSFLCTTGYMMYQLPRPAFYAYCVLILLGSIFVVVGIFRRRAEGDKSNQEGRLPGVIVACLALASFITVSLSLYYSYSVDYQAQGRYVIACIVPLALLLTAGCTHAMREWSDERQPARFDLRLWAAGCWMALDFVCILTCFPPCIDATFLVSHAL